jgi:hypothetical protein
MTSLRDAAVFYGGRLAWRVVAIEPETKNPIGFAWQKRATADPDRVRAAWTATPNMNVGILCDRVSVLDIEVYAVSALSAWLNANGYALPEGPLAWTGRGGFHLYCQPSDRHKANLMLDGQRLGELRTGNHQVVAPPSVYRDPDTGGVGRYRWAVLPSTPLPPLPDWVDQLIPPAPKPAPFITVTNLSADAGARKLEALARRVARSPEGQRNDILYWAAKRAAKEGHPQEVTQHALYRAALDCGLRERAALATIRSGWEKGVAS